jgi:hypothetical protein
MVALCFFVEANAASVLRHATLCHQAILCIVKAQHASHSASPRHDEI